MGAAMKTHHKDMESAVEKYKQAEKMIQELQAELEITKNAFDEFKN